MGEIKPGLGNAAAGTLAGVAHALKERNPSVKIALSDPMGAALYNWFTSGELMAEGEAHHRGYRSGTRDEEP